MSICETAFRFFTLSPCGGVIRFGSRDQILYQGDLQLTPHLLLLAGFHYENERVAEREPVYFIDDALTVTNYDYVFGAHGDFKSRLFYTLRGSVEHYQLFGTIFSPNAGLSYYLLRPRPGVFSGTRLTFSFAQGAREPALTEEFGSLYDFLKLNGGQATIQQLGISPIEAPTTRTWEGGGEQAFWGKHIVFRATYFHNEFGRDIESVGAGLVPALLPNLTPQQQQALEATLQSESAYRSGSQLSRLPRPGDRNFRRRWNRQRHFSPRRIHLPGLSGAAFLLQRQSSPGWRLCTHL